ncbi:FKBP-type peptidyl-prolyl cis-trans isomerase [Mesonia aquimarina]|uniref:FKBP-type peptidyl-prolyl cis-trans isomerase n=1 Tax=Mesonia aquimarina TaxID=1504967 RepID=UPI000EF560E9|nr:peptidylprolyl isomerase [Mesonia aquimarina]
MSQVKQNDTVKIHYTGKLNNGQVFDSSLEREPIEFTVGGGQIIPGLENGLIDMEVNQKKTIEISKDEAYGDAKDELFMEVPKSQLPQEIEPEVGMGLVSKNPDGTERQLRVAEVKDEAIVVDANHPLAGQDLTFEVELIEIK